MHAKRVVLAAGMAAAAILFGLLASTWSHRGGQVRVAAAADLKFALDEMVVQFEQEHPDLKVQVTYGSSGSFFAQLTNRAPFDIFLSADTDYPRGLVERGLAQADSVFLYALGRLVIWVRVDSPLDLEKLGMRSLLDPSVRKIAIANPRHAPYGRAAVAAMKNAGMYDSLEQRLVYGDNVAQAAQFVETGAADIGIVAHSLATAPALRQRGRFWDIPADAHPRIEQGGVILPWAQDRKAAEQFRDFIRGAGGKAVLRRHGFSLAEE